MLYGIASFSSQVIDLAIGDGCVRQLIQIHHVTVDHPPCPGAPGALALYVLEILHSISGPMTH